MTTATDEPSFCSFFLGGFESSSHRRSDGRRLDLLAATGHDRFVSTDCGALRQHGILTVRDALRRHLVERTPDRACRWEGVGLDPVLDYPSWDDERVCQVGLLSVADEDGRRAACPALARELARQQSIFRQVRLHHRRPLGGGRARPQRPGRVMRDVDGFRLGPPPRRAPRRRARAARARARPALPQGPTAFILHYLCARPWRFPALFAMVLGAAACAVGVQYVMKLLVDGMAGGREGTKAVLPALFAGPALLAMGPALYTWTLSSNFIQQFGAQAAALGAIAARPRS